MRKFYFWLTFACLCVTVVGCDNGKETNSNPDKDGSATTTASAKKVTPSPAKPAAKQVDTPEGVTREFVQGMVDSNENTMVSLITPESRKNTNLLAWLKGMSFKEKMSDYRIEVKKWSPDKTAAMVNCCWGKSSDDFEEVVFSLKKLSNESWRIDAMLFPPDVFKTQNLVLIPFGDQKEFSRMLRFAARRAQALKSGDQGVARRPTASTSGTVIQ